MLILKCLIKIWVSSIILYSNLVFPRFSAFFKISLNCVIRGQFLAWKKKNPQHYQGQEIINKAP